MTTVTVVDETGRIGDRELARVAAALQTQVDRDLAPHWGARAVVVPGRDVPAGGWALRLVDPGRLPESAAGVHLDDAGLPYALVAAERDWTTAASHELLEMVVDPFGNRFSAGPSADPAAAGGAVWFLVEVADPCERFGYTVDGVRVADFVLPAFYQVASSGPFDLLGRIGGALQVPAGGYLSWYDPRDVAWHQLLPDGGVATLPAAELDGRDLRGQRDRLSAGPGTFVRDDPRKSALDVVKVKERDVGPPVAATSLSGAAPSTPTSTDGGGSAFVRPHERPEVGRLTTRETRP